MTKGNENVGIIEGIGFESHKAIYAVIIIAFTMVITFLIGLPIRIIPNLYQWWTRNPIINILALLVGLSLMFFYSKSFFNGESVSGPSGVSSTLIVGDPYQVLTGWFLLTFSLLHLYPVSFQNWHRVKLFPQTNENDPRKRPAANKGFSAMLASEHILIDIPLFSCSPN
jgi:hypothetical protein